MADSKVETISRLAQWRIDNFGPCSYKKSDPFKLGIWNWYISIERNRYLYIHIFPEPSRLSKEQPPVARFILRVSNNSGPTRKFYISPGLCHTATPLFPLLFNSQNFELGFLLSAIQS
ncbi:BTB/POZ domain-containing protein At1g21780-like [Vigna umbellata]|uniref:BTB/POZ domain-containing protein At1g21780-like n=1 Tax=Vigna umbellata TaxID=87088 RepID=UPI001F5E37DF|nr:BTB/POZ domain-containing protein At1g21780-like [Vigna umbellata]